MTGIECVAGLRRNQRAAAMSDVGLVALVGGKHHSVDDRANVPFCRWHHMRLMEDNPCADCPVRTQP